MRAFATFVLCFAAQTAVALDAQSINDAQWNKQTDTKGGMSPVVVKAQILLDRAHFSPGEIDGKFGENFKKAVTTFSSAEQAVEARGEISEEVSWILKHLCGGMIGIRSRQQRQIGCGSKPDSAVEMKLDEGSPNSFSPRFHAGFI